MVSDMVSRLKTNLILTLRGEIRELKGEVARLSADAVTGLAGRGVFDHALRKEFFRAQRTLKPMALVMLDLDNFKTVNDTRGHPAGDLLLKEVAHTISNATRSSDIVCRYGGDEFVLIMPEATPSGVRKVTESVLADIKALRSRVNCAVGITMGWTMMTSDDTNTAEVLKRADDALLSAKRAGGNQIQRAIGEVKHESY